jgi:hypothetical protein
MLVLVVVGAGEDVVHLHRGGCGAAVGGGGVGVLVCRGARQVGGQHGRRRGAAVRVGADGQVLEEGGGLELRG